MMRGGTIVWMLLAIAAGISLFLLKYEVAEMEDRLAAINQRTLVNLEAVHVLKAEWSYLNRPDRLEALGRDLVALEPVRPQQTLGIADIPLRPTAVIEKSSVAGTDTAPPAVNPILPLFAKFRRTQ